MHLVDFHYKNIRMIGFYNRDGECLLRGADRIYMYIIEIVVAWFQASAAK